MSTGNVYQPFPFQIFVRNIERDEMRSGFLVTSHRKKLWNVQIGLIKEFERICKKHNLKWWACGGTLLGAARHKGFIPWDDDVDVAMLRPDYNKFLDIAADEIKYPYFLDNWYDYTIESEENDKKFCKVSIYYAWTGNERSLSLVYSMAFNTPS